jgi:hypothetical protein
MEFGISFSSLGPVSDSGPQTPAYGQAQQCPCSIPGIVVLIVTYMLKTHCKYKLHGFHSF